MVINQLKKIDSFYQTALSAYKDSKSAEEPNKSRFLRTAIGYARRTLEIDGNHSEAQKVMKAASSDLELISVGKNDLRSAIELKGLREEYCL